MTLTTSTSPGFEPSLDGAERSATRARKSRLGRALFFLYKASSANRRPACRFTPSCSEYALTALERFGGWKALHLVVRRLARCRPGGPFGWDPVPEELGHAESRGGEEH
jgi:putative membrane protein insertion efficiency factor